MKNLNVFEIIIYLPINTNELISRWIFKYIRHSNGKIEKRKAILDVTGFNQKMCINFFEVFQQELKCDQIQILNSVDTKEFP